MLVPQDTPTSVLPQHVVLTSFGSAKLAELLASLLQARKKFDPSAADHGRTGVYHALLAVDNYISEVFPQRPEVNHTLRELLYSLKSLDKGTVGPLVEPAKIDHRPPLPIQRDLLRTDAAVLMELKRLEGIERKRAADTVAGHLNKLGYRDGGTKLTGNRVAVWRGQMRKMVRTSEPAAKRYGDVLRALKLRYPDDPKAAFEYYLGCVAGMHMPTIPKKLPLK
jgi:hypothetical protein